jgi:hypothetical protein
MSDLTLSPSDEHAHVPGEERLWGESWYFDFTDRDGWLGTGLAWSVRAGRSSR